MFWGLDALLFSRRSRIGFQESRISRTIQGIKKGSRKRAKKIKNQEFEEEEEKRIWISD